MIRLGTHGWELHPGHQCDDCEPYPGLRDRTRAGTFVWDWMRDPLAETAIRQMLMHEHPPWTMTKFSARHAADHMSVLLSQGKWHVHAPVHRETGWGREREAEPEEEDIAERVYASAVQSERSPRSQAPPEEGALPPTADDVAIARSMKVAAAQGIPFCEECARAALKRTREAAVV